MNVVLIQAQPPGEKQEIGTGFVIAQTETKSLVLTCWHVVSVEDQPIPAKIKGINPTLIRHPELEKHDLVLLALPRLSEPLWRLSAVNVNGDAGGITLNCLGFSDFIYKQYSLRKVQASFQQYRPTQDASGLNFYYHELVANPAGDLFAAGMSGGPVYDALAHVVGVFRLREGSEPQAANGKAISLTPEILSLLRSAMPPGFSLTIPDPAEQRTITRSVSATDILTESPPAPPEPREQSIKQNDVQKRRWGGKSSQYGRCLFIENVRDLKYGRKRYFEFDAVLESRDGTTLQGPFFFHLHDSYKPSKIRIVKTRSDGRRAVLKGIGADGTYTIGVQFKDAHGEWRSLEYDLAKFSNRKLTKYDRFNPAG